MTFFNTLANLGNMWPDTFFLWFVDVITYKVRYFTKMIGKIIIYIISNMIMKIIRIILFVNYINYANVVSIFCRIVTSHLPMLL